MTRVSNSKGVGFALIAVFGLLACEGARATELEAPFVAAADPTEPELEEGEAAAGEPEPPPARGPNEGGERGGCTHRDNVDHDGDGLSFAAGDCNDCDPAIRAGKIDIAANGVDEDCSGKADDDATCDAALSLTSSDPNDAARALGVCRTIAASSAGWGIVAARYVRPDGTPLTDPLSYGIVDAFGVNVPSYGSAMLALSTGTARAPNQAGFLSPEGCDKGYAHGLPAGYPAPSPMCPGVTPSSTAHDGVALELRIRVPVDAHSMSFDHAFFTWDFPKYVCTQYADVFSVFLSPAPEAMPSGSIVVDALGGPVSANSPLLQVCAKSTVKGVSFPCGRGTGALEGTGFEGHGATGWLRTTVPVQPATTITLTFAIWDTGDGVSDSTVLLDSLRFWSQPVASVQTVPR